MTLPEITALPLAILAPLAVLAGCCAGYVHFRSLELVTSMMLRGNMTALALQIARMAILGGFLLVCALSGAAVLLAASLGVFIGRTRVLRSARQGNRP